MSLVDTAFLHSLTTQTDGLSMTFFPPLQCKACHREFVNRKGLRSHRCVKEEELLRFSLCLEFDEEVDYLRAMKKTAEHLNCATDEKYCTSNE